MIDYKIGHGVISIGLVESDNGVGYSNVEQSCQPRGCSPNNATVRYPWPHRS